MSKNRGRLFVFGCSFSAGSGLISEPGKVGEPQYLIGTDKYKDAIWSKYLSKDINLDCIDYSFPGASNPFIRSTILRHIQEIKKGDTVIIGITHSERMYVPLYHNRKKQVVPLHMIIEVAETLLELDKKGKRLHVAGMYIDRDLGLAIANYFIELMSNKDSYNYLLKEDIELIKNLQLFFTKMEVKCLVWEPSIWFKMESINQWTKRKFNDGHWSPNGNRFFSIVARICLEEGIGFLDRDKFKEVFNRALPIYLKHPYVDFKR